MRSVHEGIKEHTRMTCRMTGPKIEIEECS